MTASFGNGSDTIVFAPNVQVIQFPIGFGLFHTGFPLVIDGGGNVIIRGADVNSIITCGGILGSAGHPGTHRELHINNLIFENGAPAISISQNATVIANNCIFRNNKRSAIDLHLGEFVAHNCTFYNNTTEYNGGAIYCQAGAILVATNTSFIENKAPLESTTHTTGGNPDSTGGGGGYTYEIRRGYGGAVYLNNFADPSS